jgi:hypothetical protein
MTNDRAEPGQRERVTAQLRRTGADMHRTGPVHIMHAQRAHIAPPAAGILVDDWIYSLTQREAIKLSYHLSQELR